MIAFCICEREGGDTHATEKACTILSPHPPRLNRVPISAP